MHVGDMPARMSVQHTSVWHPQRPEDGVGSPETGRTQK